ncbi:MAG: lamin tail domain-containing protein [Deltaproteobacteria bacterium]|nr:lamin tail domain-containing protein [Deltaproteobacteria bacterium]
MTFLVLLACDGGGGGNGTDTSTDTGSDHVVVAPPLVINEFLASNDTTNADSAGEYDDWVEIYNAGDTIVQLDGFYVSDDADEPTKYALPEGQGIEAGGYLLVWCDGQAEQQTATEIHTSFKLNRKGDYIYLNYYDGIGVGQADAVKWEADQEADIAAARVPDGTKSWVNQTPTPAASNGG